jgi:hypothetical protein
MVNLKSELSKILIVIQPDLTGVQKIKDFESSEQLLSEAEKIVFNDASLVIGDWGYTFNLFSAGYNKINHSVEIYYLIKSKAAEINFISNLSKMQEGLRLNNLSGATIIGKFNVVSKINKLTDTVRYVVIEYSATEFEQRQL